MPEFGNSRKQRSACGTATTWDVEQPNSSPRKCTYKVIGQILEFALGIQYCQLHTGARTVKSVSEMQVSLLLRLASYSSACGDFARLLKQSIGLKCLKINLSHGLRKKQEIVAIP